MNNFLKIFTDIRQFQIFVLGMFSGMPLTIIYSTLAGWLKGAGIAVSIITTLAIARSFYSLKFIWAPLLDQIKIPGLSRLGQRKSWMCLVSAFISFIIFSYSKCDPNESMGKIYMLTLILGFSSATLDVVIDAFRIDTIAKEQQSIAAANAVFGWMLGGLISGAGAFYIAEDYGWTFTFSVLASLYIVGIIFMLTLTEPDVQREKFQINSLHSWKVMALDPFYDFLKRDGAIVILLAVIFYKLGDAMLGVVATPFYLDLGFTYKEIAWTVKVFGLTALVLGSYVGGYLMYRYGNFKGMMIGGIAQSITNLSFVWLNHQGHDNGALMIAIAIENVASGMGNAALIGYLSYLCNKKFSATQYALLSSASGLFSHTIVASGGTLVEHMGWDWYFVMTIFLAIPGLLLLLYLNKKYGLEGKKA